MNPADKNYKGNKVSALGHILDENDKPVILNGMPLLSGLQADKGGSPEQPYVKNDGSVGYLTKTGKRPGAARGARTDFSFAPLVPLLSRPVIDAELPDSQKNQKRKEFFVNHLLPVLGIATIEHGGSEETTTTRELTEAQVKAALKKAKITDPNEVIRYLMNPENRVETIVTPAVKPQTLTLAEYAQKVGEGEISLTPAQVSDVCHQLTSAIKDGLRLLCPADAE